MEDSKRQVLRRDSSSSSVSSVTSLSSDKNNSRRKALVPPRASDWKKEKLYELGIQYNVTASSLDEFTAHIKRNADYPALPKISKRLISLTHVFWTSSLDLRNIVRFNSLKAIGEINESAENLLSVEKEKKRTVEEVDQKIFEVWSCNLFCFWQNLTRLLTRLGRSGEREATYTHLFMLFSRICLLDPEPGKAYAGSKQIKGVTVHSLPGVRFNTIPSDGHLMLAVVTEAQHSEALKGDGDTEETFRAEHISSRVLGQHGMELVIESCDSYFSPCVAGMICLGTKVVFTYLDISRDHKSLIEKDSIPKEMKSNILYTKPFDYMDAQDRKEMLELLFWFGYLQSGSYKGMKKGQT